MSLREIISSRVFFGREVRWSRFVRAIVLGDEAEVARFLAKGGALYVREGDERSSLSLAAENGHLEMCRAFLDLGAKHHPCIQGRSPLVYAASAGHLDVCRLLLERGAAHEPEEQEGYTPLNFATINGDLEVCEVLLRGGADHRGNAEGWTPLHHAAAAGREDLCDLLLRFGAPIDPRSQNGVTPLTVAAGMSHASCCAFLIRRGAFADTRDDKTGRTPLIWAAMRGSEETCRALILSGGGGGGGGGTDRFGYTPLMHAVERGYSGVCRVLLDRRAARPSLEEREGAALHLAVSRGNSEIAGILLELGTPVDPLDEQGRTPLFAAVLAENREIVFLLLRAGAAPSRARRSWRAALSGLDPAIGAMLAQRDPGLFRGLTARELPPLDSIPALVLAVHALCASQPRRLALEVIVESHLPSNARPEVLELAALSCESRPLSFFCPDSKRTTGRSRAFRKGVLLRRLRSGGDLVVGRDRRLPRWIWNGVLGYVYGMPDGWMGESFWRSASAPCDDASSIRSFS